MPRVRCGDCSLELEDIEALSKHYHDEWSHRRLSAFKCAYCGKRVRDKRTLVRHLTSFHFASTDTDEAGPSASVNEQGQCLIPPSVHNDNVDDSEGVGEITVDNNAGDDYEEPISVQERVDNAAVNVLVNLRSTASLTGKAIERFEQGCSDMVSDLCTALKLTLSIKLADAGLSQESIDNVLTDVKVENPFRSLKTIDDQLKYFSDKFGLVIPEEKYLDHRTDKKLDPKLNAYVPSQVNDTFQYVSIIGTLKAVLSDRKLRDLILKGSESREDVFTSYCDGDHCKTHPFLLKYKGALYILLYYDELETANALGSKTIIHKLGAFFFQILNLPAEVSSKLSSIHLLVLVNSDDMKKPNAFKKVLTPFIHEMKQLCSDDGVPFPIDGEPDFRIRAALVALTADTAAAHDVCGFLGAGARHFCRKCMVSREEIRANANAMGPERTKEQHQEHVEKVKRRKKFSTECGVKGPCPLDAVPFFSAVENVVFDSFHDLLEGIVPLVLKLILREFIIKRKLFTVKDLNSNIASFSYGVPDAKNHPSPNFTNKMFTSRKGHLKQTGSQMWCLARCLPFLISQYLPDEEDLHMKLLFLLQDIMQIVFSFEIPSEDVETLEQLIFDHNELFFELFIAAQQESDEEEADVSVEESAPDEDEGEAVEEPVEQPAPDDNEDEEDVDDPGVGNEESDEESDEESEAPPLTSFIVYIINKLHHLKHYPGMIRRHGPPVRMWCAKFEARLKIFRQHSAVCCNFKNIPKTMAKMYQLSNLRSIKSDLTDSNVDYEQKVSTVLVKESIYQEILREAGLTDNDTISYVKSATVNGEQYRAGLFVVLPGSTRIHPNFALINDIVLLGDGSPILIVKPWRNMGRSVKFHTFVVCPAEDLEMPMLMALRVSALSNYRCIAPWCTPNEEIHMSLRTVLV